MPNVVGVRYLCGCKVYHFDAGELELDMGDTVLVDSEQGLGVARVVTDVHPEERSESDKPLKKVIRKAGEDDLARIQMLREREDEAFRVCQKKILEREMVMKLVRVEWAFDNSKATFYFTADGRVDFRDLVRDLAHRFKIRIEMRQIGVRDEAKMLGGFGPCGRELCCSTFLREFEPVSIKMAKKQDLVLNPAKISGTCGRLMCCLGYEYSFYDEIKKSERKMAAEREALAASAAEAPPEVYAEQRTRPEPSAEQGADKHKKKRRAWRKKQGKPNADQPEAARKPPQEASKDKGQAPGQDKPKRRRRRGGRGRGGPNKPKDGGGAPRGEGS
jgi:cell fate regulator YaaT (PSP1 superfamily)